MRKILKKTLCFVITVIIASFCGICAVSGAENLDREITIAQALDMISFDPISTSDLSNSYVIKNIYDRLFRDTLDAKGEKELCKDFKRVSDTEWHFTIWENVKFHDGTELTADDVVYSLRRAQGGTTIGVLFKPVKEIKKIDDHTISITTEGIYPGLTAALNHPATSILPKHYTEKAVSENDWTQPVGSGKYKFESRVIGDSIKFVRFDDYFNKNEIAKNKYLTFKVIPEGPNRTIAVETGAADLNIEFVATDYDRVISNPELKLWEAYSTIVWHLGMDNTAEWLDNKLVRQAINYAIDRSACMDVGHNGKGQVVFNSATFAPTCLGAIQNPLDKYSYNPEKAQALMEEAECPGFNTQIVVFREEAERIATAIQAYLSVININVEIVRIENAVFASYVADHKAPMFVTSWGCYWDPDMFLSRRFSKDGIGGVNRDWYLNPELDKMIAEGRSIFDEGKRAEVYKRIQEFMAEEAPEVDLYVSTLFALSNKNLKGVDFCNERVHNYWKLHY